MHRTGDYFKTIMTPHCEHVMATGIYLRELFRCIFVSKIKGKRFQDAVGKSAVEEINRLPNRRADILSHRFKQFRLSSFMSYN